MTPLLSLINNVVGFHLQEGGECGFKGANGVCANGAGGKAHLFQTVALVNVIFFGPCISF